MRIPHSSMAWIRETMERRQRRYPDWFAAPFVLPEYQGSARQEDLELSLRHPSPGQGSCPRVQVSLLPKVGLLSMPTHSLLCNETSIRCTETYTRKPASLPFALNWPRLQSYAEGSAPAETRDVGPRDAGPMPPQRKSPCRPRLDGVLGLPPSSLRSRQPLSCWASCPCEISRRLPSPAPYSLPRMGKCSLATAPRLFLALGSCLGRKENTHGLSPEVWNRGTAQERSPLD
ncbi:uncharacterized protein LOC125610796 [Marmota marmota marmota]|uniref:uncharacterized protein LOC125610796 n=1 Tax=Marmota marmota marmota TaxID=9994 RepID=UPI0020923102|nr:uncharacterized protein LOC125610796 [Marmota marmota marmota]